MNNHRQKLLIMIKKNKVIDNIIEGELDKCIHANTELLCKMTMARKVLLEDILEVCDDLKDEGRMCDGMYLKNMNKMKEEYDDIMKLLDCFE